MELLQEKNMEEGTSLEAANRSYHEAQSRMALLPNYYSWYLRHFKRDFKGKGVVLGVGAGFEIDWILNYAAHVVAVDYNERLLQSLVARHQSADLSTMRMDLRGKWPLEEGDYDFVAAFDVLEHFEDDSLFLEKAGRLLRPGGKILLKVPACQDLFGPVDVASGHYRRYERTELQRKLEEGGDMKVTTLRHINPLGLFAYRRKRSHSTNFSKTFSPAVLKVVNMGIPFLSPLDLLCPVTRGLSLVAIARKC